MEEISVIIPNYNGINFLEVCLRSLTSQKNDLDVIIVDNGSKDGSLEYIKKNYSKFTLIENEKNLGFAAAINQGIKASSGKYLLLLNNDVELEENCIANLKKCIDKNDNIFSVSSQMIQYHERNKIDDAGDEYTILGWTKRTGYGKSTKNYKTPRKIFSSCAGAALYCKRILDEIGYFDENFFAYMEDVDISYRAQIHGYECIYCPESKVYHVGSGTSGGRYNEFKVKLSARNNIYVPYKNMPWPQLFLNSPFLIIGYLIKYFFFLRKGYGSVYLAGLKEGLNSLEKIEKIKYSNENLFNYMKIEYKLIKNTFSLLLQK